MDLATYIVGYIACSWIMFGGLTIKNIESKADNIIGLTFASIAWPVTMIYLIFFVFFSIIEKVFGIQVKWI